MEHTFLYILGFLFFLWIAMGGLNKKKGGK